MWQREAGIYFKRNGGLRLAWALLSVMVCAVSSKCAQRRAGRQRLEFARLVSAVLGRLRQLARGARHFGAQRLQRRG